MKFTDAIDPFIADGRAEGRINSDNTEDAYRLVLLVHAEDVGNRDPKLTSKEDVKRTLRRYENPRTRKQRHAVLISFYDWTVWEGMRRSSPAREVRPVRAKPAVHTRLTRGEIVALLDAAAPVRRDRWAVSLMLGLGMRNAELRGARKHDFMRPGWVHIIGKGGKERWAPVVPEFAPIVEEILALVARPEDFVLPGRRTLDPGINQLQRDEPQAMLSSSALGKQIGRVADRAGLAVHVTPHTLRHAYGDAVARYAGVRVAQTVLGHSSIETTVGTYTGAMTLDELAASLTGFEYRHASPLSRADQTPAEIKENR